MFLCPQPKKLELKKGYYHFPVGEEPQIQAEITPLLGQKESYRLEVDQNGVHIQAADEAGLFYSKLTLKQLMLNYRGCLPFIYIYDEPDYSYRGFMIDVCRHFFSVEDLQIRAKISKTVIEMLRANGVLDNISETDQMTMTF